jgi:hypothetical protein
MLPAELLPVLRDVPVDSDRDRIPDKAVDKMPGSSVGRMAGRRVDADTSR